MASTSFLNDTDFFQVASFMAPPGMAPVLPSDFDSMLPPPDLGVTVSGIVFPCRPSCAWNNLCIPSRPEILTPF